MYKSIINCFKNFVNADFEKLSQKYNFSILRYDYFNVEKAAEEANIKKLLEIRAKLEHEIQTPTIEEG